MSDTERKIPANDSQQVDLYKYLLRLATYASVIVATILIFIKIHGWIETDSVSLLSSLLDSVLDAGASILNLIAVRHALVPADKEHRFGHGKAEALAGLVQAAFIAGSGVFLLLELTERMFNPREVSNSETGIVIMMIAILLTATLVGFQTFVIRKTNSLAIIADSFHYKADLLVNIAVIISLFISVNLKWTLADPIFALLIISYMGYGGYKIGIKALDVVMDKEFPDADREKIRNIAVSHEKVLNVHDMRTRSSGYKSFIQFHAEMPKNISLAEAHSVADEVMFEVEKAFPNTEVLIHQDPEGVDERRDYV